MAALISITTGNLSQASPMIASIMADVKPLGVRGPQQTLGIVGARMGAMLRWTHPSNRGLKTADGLGAAGLILLCA